MNPKEKTKKPPVHFYGWYFKGEPQEVHEKGKKSETQGMFPHYRIEIKTSIGPNIKIGNLSGYNAGAKEWFSLNQSNISGDRLYNARKESLAKNHFLYIKGFGVWKVDGLSVDEGKAVIQITRFNI